MRRNFLAALALTFSAFAFASPALGQGYKSAAGFSGGVFFPTALNDGAVGAGELVEMKPDPTLTMNAHYDYWLGSGHLGLRGTAGLSRAILPWTQGDRKIRVFAMDLGFLLRPIASAPGKTVLPFINGGVGLINWGMGDGAPMSYNPAGANYDGDENFDFMAAVGFGLDIVSPWEWGEGPVVVRLEGRDFMQFDSPFEPTDPSDSAFGMIHNFSVVLGFHTALGSLDGR